MTAKATSPGAERRAPRAEPVVGGLEADESLDRIVRLVGRVLSVPLVAIALLDGQRITPVAANGPRAQTLATDGAVRTLLLDQKDDAPVVAHDIVTALDVRAVAAHVLKFDGVPIGLLVVGDDQRRSFDATEVALFVDLAHWAAAALRAAQERASFTDAEIVQRRNHIILASVASGIVGVDAHGIVNFVNPAASALLGWPEGALIGARFHAVAHHRRADGSPYPAIECPVTETLRSGTSAKTSADTYWKRDGSPLLVDWSMSPLVTHGNIVGAVVVFDDVSTRLELERAKAAFIAVVSHELRTPLTSLMGALRLLDRTADTGGEATEASLLDIAVRNADRLKRLVDDVVDVGKMSWAELGLDRHPVAVIDLLTSATTTVSGMALTHGVTIAVNPCQASVWGDEHRLTQVLTNLVGNAIRFSAAGSTVTLGAVDHGTTVTITIADAGVGIPPEALAHIFEPFWQVDPSDTRSQSGSGLGLAIAKNLVELHGGTIAVSSDVGVGTTFAITLPVDGEEGGTTT